MPLHTWKGWTLLDECRGPQAYSARPRRGHPVGPLQSYVRSSKVSLMASIPSYLSASNPRLSNLRLAAASIREPNRSKHSKSGGRIRGVRWIELRKSLMLSVRLLTSGCRGAAACRRRGCDAARPGRKQAIEAVTLSTPDVWRPRTKHKSAVLAGSRWQFLGTETQCTGPIRSAGAARRRLAAGTAWAERETGTPMDGISSTVAAFMSRSSAARYLRPQSK